MAMPGAVALALEIYIIQAPCIPLGEGIVYIDDGFSLLSRNFKLLSFVSIEKGPFFTERSIIDLLMYKCSFKYFPLQV
jgi:hypothetical protein